MSSPNRSDRPRSRQISRRQFLRDASTGTAGLALLSPARAAGALLPSRRPTVAVFGGGISGLTTAHELAERGFAVSVYERRAWGGKAQSTEVQGTGTGGRRPLPSEHGYRIEFGFYQNLPDTMKRIPFGSNPNGVIDNMVEAPQVDFARMVKNDLVLPLGGLDPRPCTPAQVYETLLAVLVNMELPPDAMAHFAQRMVVFMSSCDARRLGQWEKMTWTDFIGTANYPEDYAKTVGNIPRFAQASRAATTSARFVGRFLEALTYSLLGFGANGPTFRVLNRPTNEAWIDPWTTHLRNLGVQLKLGYALTQFVLSQGQIHAAIVNTPTGPQRVSADYYVCALPVERARALWSSQMLAVDPSLAAMQNIETAWMNGIMFYLNQQPQIVKGDVYCVDSPWAVTLMPQAQFWNVDFASTYGDGNTREKLSAIIADWHAPGTFNNKTAAACTPAELIHELWAQIKAHVNKAGQSPKLTDDMVTGTNIDPGMTLQGGVLVSGDPLFIPSVNTQQYRPEVSTGIRNLLLCGDYVNGSWEGGFMEPANLSGRNVANTILALTGSAEPRAAATPPYDPPEWEALKAIDQIRYQLGQPNLFDTQGPLTANQISSLLTNPPTT